MSNQGWIGVDLDGTLAHYEGEGWGDGSIGEPIKPMVKRVQAWIKKGIEVRIMTARVAYDPRQEQRDRIEIWCFKHIGRGLPITMQKDMGMIALYDDRAVAVEKNTGKLLSPALA